MSARFALEFPAPRRFPPLRSGPATLKGFTPLRRPLPSSAHYDDSTRLPDFRSGLTSYVHELCPALVPRLPLPLFRPTRKLRSRATSGASSPVHWFDFLRNYDVAANDGSVDWLRKWPTAFRGVHVREPAGPVIIELDRLVKLLHLFLLVLVLAGVIVQHI